MCLSCGHDKHFRADGACIECGCAALVKEWPAEAAKPAQKSDEANKKAKP